MEQLLKRAGMAALGIVVMLAWWSFKGGGSSSAEVQGIPTTVWEGGGGILNLSVETTSPARFSISFSDGEDRSMETWTPVGPGSHSWAVDVPRGAGGYIELGAENPKVGDKLHWKITFDGNPIEEQSETLDEPLQPGYAFFLQSAYDDYTEMKPE